MPSFADVRLQAPSPAAAADSPAVLWSVRGGVFAAAVLLYVWGTGDIGLWNAGEGRTAQIAQNFFESHQHLLPRLHTGAVDLETPPLYGWLAGVSARLSGRVNGSAIRLPAFLAAAAALWLVFEFGRAIGGLSVGLTAATILGCTTRFAWLARVARGDMVFAAAALGCLFVFWRARVRTTTDKRELSLPLVFYGALSVAILAKGLVALVHIGTPIILWLAWRQRPIIPVLQRQAWREWRMLRVLPGTAIVVFGAGWWLLYAHVMTANSAPTESWLAAGDDAHTFSSWWVYLPRLVGDSFPWSLLLPAVAVRSWKARGQKQANGKNATNSFLTAWLFGQFATLSLLGGRKMDALLPLYPAAALLIADWLGERRQRFFQRRQTTVACDYRGRSQWVLATACLLAALAAPFIYWGERQFTRKGGLAKTVLHAAVFDRHLNETDEFMLLRVESILREHWPLLGIMLPALVASVWLVHTGWHDRLTGRIVGGLALPWALCFLLQTHVVLPRLDGLREMERFAQTIRRLAGDGRMIYYFDEPDADLVFHAGKPARVVADWGDLTQLARGPTPVFVVLRSNEWKRKSAEGSAAGWSEIANNCQFARHREPRSFLTNRPDEVADRLHLDRDQWLH